MIAANNGNDGLSVNRDGYCSLVDWAKEAGLSERSAITLCKKTKTPMLKVGGSYIVQKVIIDEAFSKDMISQKQSIFERRESAKDRAEENRKAAILYQQFLRYRVNNISELLKEAGMVDFTKGLETLETRAQTFKPGNRPSGNSV